MISGKISIIVPIYNSEDKLERCINSILSQSYKDIEIILINDGSTDESLKICEEFKNKDKRIILIDKKNAGVSAARNCGLDITTGEYIQFVDSDDYIKPNMCECLLKGICKSKADVVICGYDRTEKNKITSKFPKEATINKLYDFKDTFSELFNNALFNAPWNKLYRKERIKKYFKENLSIGEDLLFNLSYFSDCDKIVMINDCLYNYDVLSQESLASQYDDNLFNIEVMLYKEVQKFLGDSFKTTDFRYINNVFAKEIYYFLKKLVILSGDDKKTKLEHIKNCIENKDVKSMLSNIDLSDNQIKIVCFFMKRKCSHCIYLFFKLKGLINKRGIH